tara:strand:- start:484 stop:1470 length:987 start_codon:yes stop_codon:yes gene_type:complete
LNNKKIVIEKRINLKKDFQIKNNLDDYFSLNYFFDSFLLYRKEKGRYPSINKWRENIVMSLLENLSTNNSLEFSIEDLDSNKKLKENICRYQRNKIFLYDLGLTYILKFIEDNGVFLNSNIIERSLEIFKDSINNNFYGLSKSSEIEKEISNSLSKIIYFEKRLLPNSFTNYLTYELYLALEELKNPDNCWLYALDKILINMGYTISSKNIVDNLDYFIDFFNKEEEYFTERFNCKNIFSNKYYEISLMILDVLNPEEKDLIRYRYGFGKNKRYTLKEIYEIKKYKNYKSLIEDLIKVLWKLKITWPSGLLFKFLFGSTKERFEESLF